MSGDGSDPNALPPALPAGFPRPFGPYLLLSSYGRGGMGEVFLAQRTVTAARQTTEAREELCVLKTLRRDLCTDKSYVRRFLDEARIVVRLEHPNICAVFDVGQAGDEYFMTMEHIAGTNLRELLATLVDGRERLPPQVALWFGSEMLAALSWAHHATDPQTKQTLNVVHRDVSPHNVMVAYDGNVKLIDFGLAESTLKQEQTESHVVMGKVAYMSPEQARGDEVDATCDQFAAAVVLYECLTQDRYYGDLTTPRIWAVAGLGTYVPRRMHELAPELQAILTKALAGEPRARFTSCNEFREALDGVRKRCGMVLGNAEAAGMMERLFADRIKAHDAIAKAYSSSTRVAPGVAPRAERPVNLVATRSGMSAALTSSLPAPNLAELTERVDRDANVFRTSGLDQLPVSDAPSRTSRPSKDDQHTARVARNTGSMRVAPPRRSPAVYVAGLVAAAAIALLVVVTTRPPPASVPVAAPLAPVGQASAPAHDVPVVVAPPVVVVPPSPVVAAPPVNETPPVVESRPKIKKPVEAKPIQAKPVDVVESKPVEPAAAGPDLNAKTLVFGYETTKRIVLACGTLCPAPVVARVGASIREADLTGTLSPAVNKCVRKCMNAGIK